MPVFSLRSQRLSGEFPNHRPPENHRLPNEPSPIFGHSALGPAARTPGVPNEPSPISGHFVVRQPPMGSLRTFYFFLPPGIRALQRPSKL